MTDWVLGSNGASCRVMAESRGAPYGMLHPGLLDGALHCIPFYRIEYWYPEIAKGINVIDGKVTYAGVAEAFGLDYVPLESVIAL